MNLIGFLVNLNHFLLSLLNGMFSTLNKLMVDLSFASFWDFYLKNNCTFLEAL